MLYEKGEESYTCLDPAFGFPALPPEEDQEVFFPRRMY